MLGEKDDLGDVVDVVRHRAVQRLESGEGLAANGDSALQVLRLQRGDGIEGDLPAGLPHFHKLGARGVAAEFEFLVAMAVGFLAVAGEEVGEARADVARDVLHQHRDAVRFRIELEKKLAIAQLRDGAFGQTLVPAQRATGFVEIGGGVVHAAILVGGRREVSTKN